MYSARAQNTSRHFSAWSAQPVHGVQRSNHDGDAPQQSRTRSNFDQAVQSKTDQGNGTGDNPANGDQTLKAVVGDCEVFEKLALANDVFAILNAGSDHTFIIV